MTEYFGNSSLCVAAAVCAGRVICLRASGCSWHFIGGGGRFDGGVVPVIEGDCCNILGESGCSGDL